MNRGWDPLSSPCATVMPPIDGPLSALDSAVWSSNQPATSQRVGWVFLTVRGSVDPRKRSIFFFGWLKFYRFGTTSGPGRGPYPPEVELAQHANPSQSEIGRWGWDFHTVRGGTNPDNIHISVFVPGLSEL